MSEGKTSLSTNFESVQKRRAYRVNILIMSSAARITTVKYTVDDHISAEFIRDIQLGRLTFDSADILNTVLYSVVTDCVVNV